MEALWMLAVLAGVGGWLNLRSRMRFIEGRLDVLAQAVWRVSHAEPAAAARPSTVEPAFVPPSPEPREEPQPTPPEAEERIAPAFPETGPADVPHAAPVAAEPALEHDWEAVLGGNWTNKIGVFVVVVGLALLLNYAYTHMGAAGRVAVSFAGAVAMLGAGIAVERMEKYRTFAYGLIGGGWAALYLTTFAIHAIPAARVLDNALVAVLLLLAVAAGMIVHSLRYRSRTVTGLAYFIAFATLGISEVTAFSVVAVVPLAASLLWIAHRNQWQPFAVFGVVATYVTVAMHPDTGSPLWQTQALFLVYWLLFEAFDILHPDPWLLPLNALGFLTLSGAKWTHALPDQMWIFAAGASALYLGSTAVRAQSGRWRPAVALNAALAAVAIVLKVEGEWRPLALLIEGEIFYLAGVQLGSLWLRGIGLAVFGIDLGFTWALVRWERPGIVNAVVFYANRVVRPADVFFGYAGAVLAAFVAWQEAEEEWLGRIWSLMAVAPFAIGWWRRLPDFRAQAYGFAAIGTIATAVYGPHPPAALAVSAALSYALVLCTLWSGEDRFFPRERYVLRAAASLGASVGAAALLWKLVPDAYLGMAWAGLALLLLEAGLRNLPAEFEEEAAVLAVVAFTKCVWTEGPAPATAVAIACFAAATLRSRRGHPLRTLYAILSGGLLTVLIFQKVSGSMLTISWGAEGVALLAAGFAARDRVLRLSGLALLGWCIGKLFFWDLRNLDTLPRIVSFIVLGLLLVGVSWVYTRFKDQVSKLL
jgi:uncharacterized membrane protein